MHETKHSKQELSLFAHKLAKYVPQTYTTIIRKAAFRGGIAGMIIGTTAFLGTYEIARDLAASESTANMISVISGSAVGFASAIIASSHIKNTYLERMLRR